MEKLTEHKTLMSHKSSVLVAVVVAAAPQTDLEIDVHKQLQTMILMKSTKKRRRSDFISGPEITTKIRMVLSKGLTPPATN